MPIHPVRRTLPIVAFLTTGLAGTGLATVLAAPVPQVALASVECPIGASTCGEGLIGNAAAPVAVAASATANASAFADLFFIVGNGTPDHPDAGWLIGNGYSFTENDVDVSPFCTKGSPCNGGNAGLLFGDGGNGYDGGSGGNSYIYGEGGNGGNAVDFGVVSENNDGGNGGHGGIFGGTDSSSGTLFRAGGGNGGNGIHGGSGGDGGDAGWGLDLIPAVIGRITGLSLDVSSVGILNLNILSFSGTGGRAGNGGDGFVGLVNGSLVSMPNGGTGGNAGDSAQLPLLDPGQTVLVGGNGGNGWNNPSGVGGNGGNGGDGGNASANDATPGKGGNGDTGGLNGSNGTRGADGSVD